VKASPNPDLEKELESLIAERDVITARIYEIRRELDRDRRGPGVVNKGEFAGLPFRAVVYLRRAGFRTREKVEELYQREGRAGLARLRRIGPGTADAVEMWLAPARRPLPCSDLSSAEAMPAEVCSS
jgi:hypothetical protein